MIQPSIVYMSRERERASWRGPGRHSSSMAAGNRVGGEIREAKVVSRAEMNEALHFITEMELSEVQSTGKDTEAQRGRVTFLTSHSMLIKELEP